MFYEKIRTKQDLSYISVCSLSILYNGKFIVMTTSLGTNAVVTRVHYMCRTMRKRLWTYTDIEDPDQPAQSDQGLHYPQTTIGYYGMFQRRANARLRLRMKNDVNLSDIRTFCAYSRAFLRLTWAIWPGSQKKP